MPSLTMKPSLGDGDVNWYALLIAIVKGVSSEAALGAMGISHCTNIRPKGTVKRDYKISWRNQNRDLAIYAAHDAGMGRVEIAELFGITRKCVGHVLDRRKIHMDHKEVDP